MIDKQKTLDVFYIFSQGMMITDSKDLGKFEKRLGVDAREFVKNLINGIAIDGIKDQHIEDFERHIIFIKEACQYILNERDDLPIVSVTYDDKKNMKYKI